ncbi:hypothetical protein EPN96_01385 [bacterium]|nr:MAG: hypothetical protein EPN96_01385 [bacterium]
MTLSAVPLPETLKRGVDPASPLSTRLAFARGDVPMSATERLGVLTHLAADPHGEVRKTVDNAICALETSLIEKALGIDSLHPAIIDLLATHFSNVSRILYKIVSHPNISEETLHRFAGSRDPQLLRTIAENNPSLANYPSVIGELLRNPCLGSKIAEALQETWGEGPLSEIELESFAVEEPPAEPECESPAEEVFASPAEAAEVEAEPSVEEVQEEEEVLLPGGEIDEEEVAKADISNLPDELLKDMTDSGSTNLYKIIGSLSIAEKIKLATLGSKGARKLLARDSNRTVVNAVIRSPKLREDEVLAIASDKITPDEIIYFILTKKEWLKEYSLRLALSQNPKTPPQKAFRLLETLYDKDIKHISKSKNVPQIIAQAASRISQRREKKKH